MTRCLTEVPNENIKQIGERAIQVLREPGSNLMTNVDWVCCDGEPNSWLVVDLESDGQANDPTLQQFGPYTLGQTREVHAYRSRRPSRIR